MLERRPPERAFLHGLALATGVGYLTFVPAPGSIQAAVPTAIVYIWAATLAAGGGVGLWAFFALFRRKPLSARLYGRVAVRLQLAGVLLWLGATVASWEVSSHRPAFPYFGVLIFGGWAATTVARDRQLASEIKAITGGGTRADVGNDDHQSSVRRGLHDSRGRAVPGMDRQADLGREGPGIDGPDRGRDDGERRP